MTIDVIGAGFGRTGTLSLKAALELLGLEPCWHIEDMRRGEGTAERHLDAWSRLAAGESMDWEWLLRDFRATSDFPICLYYRELIAAFPDARVVLTVREPMAWVASVRALYEDAFLVRSRRPENQSGRGRIWVDTVRTLVWDRMGDMSDDASLARIYQDHIQAVQEAVDPDRLLVFEVTEGWRPLCSFLDVRVPDAAFPHVNDRASLRKDAQPPN
jgi:hypothetical protein